MDTRRTFIAIAISFLILVGWNYLSVQMGWIPDRKAEQQVVENTQTPAATETAATLLGDSPAPLPAFAPAPGREVVVETPLYRAVFYSSGGILRDFSLKNFRSRLGANAPNVQIITPAAAATAPMGLLVDGAPSWSGTSWNVEGNGLALKEGDSGSLRFVGEVNGMRVVREFTFLADTYAIKEKTQITSPVARNLRLAHTFGTSSLNDSVSEYDKTRIAYLDGSSFKEEDSAKTLKAGIALKGEFPWAGVMSNYFLGVISPQDRDVAMRFKLQDDIYRIAVEKSDIVAHAGQPVSLETSYYIGPKDQDLLNAQSSELGLAINYGMFSVIARPLLLVLNFFYKHVGNYGLAIILLTIVIKIILWPLSHKSYKSMEQMKKLQPMIQKLKEKYGDDKEAMNRETMQLYRAYKVNPASGCLPILVQIPVFIGLYQGLMGFVGLRHAPFVVNIPFTDIIWLADLSAKDPYYITPLVMGGTMFLQQYLTPSAGDPTQQKIMMLMPVIFTFMFLNFPSGLVVYWLANNVISIAQQWWQLRRA